MSFGSQPNKRWRDILDMPLREALVILLGLLLVVAVIYGWMS